MVKRMKTVPKTASRRAASVASSSVSSDSVPTLLFENPNAWQSWLEAQTDEKTGVWLKMSKKGAATPTLTYEQALDVALCYGWIDGQRKSHDDQHFLQRFTPRRKTSSWSKRNVDKVAVLIEAGRMQPAGQAEIDAAKADGRWSRAYAGSSMIQVPEDFRTALARDKKASKFFDALNKTQRYAFLWRIETAKRPETRQRRIVQFVELLAEHKTL